MNVLKLINKYRRTLTQKFFVSAFGAPAKNELLREVSEVKKVLIVRPNHRLGNQLLITPLLQDVINHFPEAKVDLFLKGNAGKIIFKNYQEVNKIIALPRNHFKEIITYLGCWFYLKKQKYDLIINVIAKSSSGTLATKITKSRFKFYGITEDHDSANNISDNKHIAKKPVYDFREQLKLISVHSSVTEVPKINLRINQTELDHGKKKLREITKTDKETICIFTYATDDKRYSKEWWFDLYHKLQQAFSTFTIIEILPVENVSQIDFKAPHFYSKDVREIAAVISNASLFIGADSGMMHLASATKTTTIGLFSVTNIEMYQPYSGKNTAINTNNLDSDEIVNTIKVLM